MWVREGVVVKEGEGEGGREGGRECRVKAEGMDNR